MRASRKASGAATRAVSDVELAGLQRHQVDLGVEDLAERRVDRELSEARSVRRDRGPEE